MYSLVYERNFNIRNAYIHNTNGIIAISKVDAN